MDVYVINITMLLLKNANELSQLIFHISIAVLRVILLRESDPEKWAIVQRMMDHDKEHRAKRENWQFYKENVVDFIRNTCGLESKFTEDDVFHVLGALDVNSVRIHSETTNQVFFSGFIHKIMALIIK